MACFSTNGFSQQKHAMDYNPNTGKISYPPITSGYFIIKSIQVSGNKKTKDRIIKRELDLVEGDTLFTNHLEEDLLWIKNRIFNLSLFFWVDLTISGEDSIQKNLYIDVRERLNISPLPEGGLADRNFNEWWQDRNHDLGRIYLGINLKMKNVWGLNHIFKLRAYTVFNHKLESSYQIPYLNKKLKTGLIINSLIEINPQVAAQTKEHKLDYHEINHKGREKYSIGFMFIRRNIYYGHHQLGPYFQYASIADSISRINPNYFLDTSRFQRSYGLKYNYTFDRRDFNNYPLKGFLFKFEADYQHLVSRNKYDILSIKSEATKFFPLRKGFYLATGLTGKLSSPNNQPYFTQRGMGYGNDVISGYELYVIDGQSYGLLKSNLRWRLLSANPTFGFIPHHHFRTVPISVYLKIFSDAGYVVDNTYNPLNATLSNRLLTGGGVGLDIVTYLNFVVRMEYAINQFGQTGLYIHLKSGW